MGDFKISICFSTIYAIRLVVTNSPNLPLTSSLSPHGHNVSQNQEVRPMIRRGDSLDWCRRHVFLIRIRRVAFPVFRFRRHPEYRVIPLETDAFQSVPPGYRELFETDRRPGGHDIGQGFESSARKVRLVP